MTTSRLAKKAGISVQNGEVIKLNVITTGRDKGGVPMQLSEVAGETTTCFYTFTHLPKPMNKLDAAKYLLTLREYQDPATVAYLQAEIAKRSKTEITIRVATDPDTTSSGIDAIKQAVKQVVREAARKD
jgi:hypothetical protein